MSTSQPFKFRHLDSIVGAFVLAAVAIVIAALALIGSAKQWFTPKTEVSASTILPDLARPEFIEEMGESLRIGTPVELSGHVVGKVVATEAANGLLHLRLEVSDRALELLHQGEIAKDGRRTGDARALIKVPLAPFMGQPRVVLKAGTAGVEGWKTDAWHEHHAIAVEPPRDSTSMAMHVLQDLEANLGPMMAALTGLVGESHELISEIRAQHLPQQAGAFVAGLAERQVPQRLDALLARIEAIAATTEATAADAKRIAAGLVEGKGIAGKALSDAKLGDDLAGLAADLRAITAELRKVAPTAPALADGTRNLLDEVQRLVDGLNRHWLLRAYTAPGDGERIVPPGIIAAPEDQP